MEDNTYIKWLYLYHDNAAQTAHAKSKNRKLICRQSLNDDRQCKENGISPSLFLFKKFCDYICLSTYLSIYLLVYLPLYHIL